MILELKKTKYKSEKLVNISDIIHFKKRKFTLNFIAKQVIE